VLDNNYTVNSTQDLLASTTTRLYGCSRLIISGIGPAQTKLYNVLKPDQSIFGRNIQSLSHKQYFKLIFQLFHFVMVLYGGYGVHTAATIIRVSVNVRVVTK